ncbi:hypothetical protein [Halalkalibacter alkalisediminis]|nr:hypothetical protein [Halalkalibacter alkalisediminis]
MSGFLAADARFYEYKNFGPGVLENICRNQLTDDEANGYTKTSILDGWNPGK